MKKILKIGAVLLLLCMTGILIFAVYSYKSKPESIQYGMSFNTLYANELGLDWKEVYDAFLDDLGVRHLRLAAHWPMVEPRSDVYNFSELDYQVARAEEVGAEVVFAVGRRLPRWPECHIPNWMEGLEWEKQKQSLLEYLEVTVTRYKDSPAITYWQVENEPYLEMFAEAHCGQLDEDFFAEEIDLVRSIDPTRPILVTDSGNLGTWLSPYKYGDAFGTSVYVYFWNPELGQFKTILPPWMYWWKEGLARLIYGRQETILIELSAEPWLIEPITEVDVETQLTRMNLEKFEDILDYAERTRFAKQYLWGGEWWYWLAEKGRPEMWEKGREIFSE